MMLLVQVRGRSLIAVHLHGQQPAQEVTVRLSYPVAVVVYQVFRQAFLWAILMEALAQLHLHIGAVTGLGRAFLRLALLHALLYLQQVDADHNYVLQLVLAVIH